MTTILEELEPASAEEAADAMRSAGGRGAALRVRGGGTKLDWGEAVESPAIQIHSGGLDRLVEHNAGDLTAVLEAGVTLAHAQETFAERGQMLAVDPPPGADGAATIGGIVAAADEGPLRHRFGGVRDLLLGMRVALSDGTLARSGGKVIKNVAGYDVAKLFAGSFGTLGMIVEVVVRLHPRPAHRLTLALSSDDPDRLFQASATLARAPLEMDALDVTWNGESGAVLGLFGGAAPDRRVEAARRLVAGAGVQTSTTQEAAIWDEQRARQRASSGAVVRVSGLATDLPAVIRAAGRADATLVGRAALGLYWVHFPAADDHELVGGIEELRGALSPRPCVVLDAPAEVRTRLSVWGAHNEGAVALMRRVKERFDPAGVCNPGIFVGGI